MDRRKLWIRTIVLSALYFLILGLVLFWLAGTFRYWQAWVYLGIYAVLGFVACRDLLRRDPHLLDKRMKGGPWAEPDPAQKIIQSLNVLAIMATYIVCGWDYGGHGPRVATAFVLIGDAGILLAVCGFWAVARQNRFAYAIVTVQEDQKVVDTGLYALVRHPMYAMVCLMMLATPFALASLWGLVPAAVTVACVITRLLYEERYLTDRLPGYAAYRSRVRYRLLPHIW